MFRSLNIDYCNTLLVLHTLEQFTFTFVWFCCSHLNVTDSGLLQLSTVPRVCLTIWYVRSLRVALLVQMWRTESLEDLTNLYQCGLLFEFHSHLLYFNRNSSSSDTFIVSGACIVDPSLLYLRDTKMQINCHKLWIFSSFTEVIRKYSKLVTNL